MINIFVYYNEATAASQHGLLQHGLVFMNQVTQVIHDFTQLLAVKMMNVSCLVMA